MTLKDSEAKRVREQFPDGGPVYGRNVTIYLGVTTPLTTDQQKVIDLVFSGGFDEHGEAKENPHVYTEDEIVERVGWHGRWRHPNTVYEVIKDLERMGAVTLAKSSDLGAHASLRKEVVLRREFIPVATHLVQYLRSLATFDNVHLKDVNVRVTGVASSEIATVVASV